MIISNGTSLNFVAVAILAAALGPLRCRPLGTA